MLKPPFQQDVSMGHLRAGILLDSSPLPHVSQCHTEGIISVERMNELSE